jgi:hypothetical protein
MPSFFIIVLAFLVVTSIWWYLLPAWIASRKGSHDSSAILFLNVFFGWTGVGWVVALFWAFMARDHRVPGRTYPFYLLPRTGAMSGKLEHL